MARERVIRLQVMLEDDEMKAIENWRFNTRAPNRSEAIRELMRRGLAAEGVKVASTGGSSPSDGAVHSPETK